MKTSTLLYVIAGVYGALAGAWFGLWIAGSENAEWNVVPLIASAFLALGWGDAQKQLDDLRGREGGA